MEWIVAGGMAAFLYTFSFCAIQERFVKQRCDAGQRLEYLTYAAREHLSVVVPDSPLNADLVRWTQDRFAGKPQNPGRRMIPR
jgi:hypothetical protein